MQQLSLFDEEPLPEQRAPDLPVPEAGTQLDLFADRLLLLVDARRALAQLAPEAARPPLREALARYPGDAQLAEAIAELDELSFRVEQALRARADQRAAALVAVADRIEPIERRHGPWAEEASFPHRDLWNALLVRAANQAIERDGDTSLVGGRLESGALLLLSGEMESARASLMRALDSTGRSRYRALLGEHARRGGDRTLAMHHFFSALRDDPYDVDLSLLGDEDVRGLPEVGRDRFGIDEEPMAWCAAVGVVTGLFHLPMIDGVESPRAPRSAAIRPERAPALSRAEDFLSALAASRRRPNAADLVAARRAMKRLQPLLFDAVMGRPTDR